MTHDAASASVLNEKFREDALHAFVSGLKKSLKVAVFPAQPRDLPTALVLAQEAESSNDRRFVARRFVASFARHAEEKTNKANNYRPPSWKNISQRSNSPNREQNQSTGAIKKNPHFVKNQNWGNNKTPSLNQKPSPYSGNSQARPAPEPMDVDTLSQFRQSTNWRKGESTRSQQKINYLPEEKLTEEEYDSVAQAYATEIEDDLDADDTCNFLE